MIHKAGGILRLSRQVFFLAFILFFGNFLSAQERPYWYTLEQGKLFYRSGEYGKALVAFEDARRSRRESFGEMEMILIDFLSTEEARRRGDSLERVEAYINERGRRDAAARVLDELYFRYPKESLGDSVKAALNAIGELKFFPEAEYWIGEVYRVEGELGIALDQYTKAYERRSLLENPRFDGEILYRIAEIHSLRREFIEMEAAYLEILKQDEFWSRNQDNFLKNSMIRILENDGIDRFMTIYRSNNTQAEKVHRLLGFYYYTSGRYNRAADHLLFAFLIQNSVLAAELSKRRLAYTFTDMRSLMNFLPDYPELADYTRDTEYYKTIYYLGTSLYGDGKLKIARDFWNLLRGNTRAGEWRRRAENQLVKPFVEQVRERP